MKVVGSGIPGGWHGFHLMSGKHLHHVCGDLGHDIYNYHSELTHPQTAGLQFPTGKLGMIYSDWRGKTDQSAKYDNLSMFGKENIMNRGMVIYAEEDKVIRNTNSPPPNLGVSDKIP